MKQLYSSLLIGAISVLNAGLANATTYISSTSKTSVNLAEKRNPVGGFYFTTIGNRNFFGDIKINRAEGAAGAYYYNGTFSDRTIGSGTPITCSGDISIVRRTGGRTAQLGAEMTWKVKGGENCPNVGQTFTINLVEALPRPNAQGDFTSENANTWLTQTAGLATWPAWRVTSKDGELNCRKQPNGEVVKVYRATDTVEAELRSVNALELINGVWWMFTRNRCYVRANSQYIEPISLPD